MVLLSDFRKEQSEKSSRLMCNIKLTVGGEKLPSDILWISTDNECDYFLNERICDGYMLIGLVLGMYYGQDVRVCGKVSKKLYENLINYGQQILVNHDPGLKKVDVIVDGFLSEEDFAISSQHGRSDDAVVGSPCSLGVDAMFTLLKKWKKTDEYQDRINTVFSFNCGLNGEFGKKETLKLKEDRTRKFVDAFSQIGLPIVDVDTNVHQFLHNRTFVYATACYLGRYFCILNMQGGLKKYYVPSEFSYKDIMRYGDIPYQMIMRGTKDIGLGYEEPFFLPLLSTEHLEIVLDGCEQQRTEKIEIISNWEFSHKYLNVCQPGRQVTEDYSCNCSRCPKCLYTMLCLDVIGKLDLYSTVFDLEYYYSHKVVFLYDLLQMSKDVPLISDVLECAKKYNVKIPTEEDARTYYFYKWRFNDIDKYISVLSMIRKGKITDIIIWGAGWIGSQVLAALDVLGESVSEIIDADSSKTNQRLFNHYIKGIDQIDYDKYTNADIYVCGAGIYNEVKSVVGNRIECIDISEEVKRYNN